MLTLKDIVESGLIKDDTRITTEKYLAGGIRETRRGNWFHDPILEYLEEEIAELTWSEISGLVLSLKRGGEDE